MRDAEKELFWLGRLVLLSESESSSESSHSEGYRDLSDLAGPWSTTRVSVRALPWLSTVRTTDVFDRERGLGASVIEERELIELQFMRLSGDARRERLVVELLRLRESNEPCRLVGRELPVVLLLRMPGLTWASGLVCAAA